MKTRFEEMDTFLKELMARAMNGEKIEDGDVYDALEFYHTGIAEYNREFKGKFPIKL